jgi:lipopolysaccharide assembly outer membrane protein LptD (OstA)
MKLLIAVGIMAQLVSAPQTQKLNLNVGSATIQAESIERPVQFPSIIRLKGNIQIDTKIIAQHAPVSLLIMVVRADEADYHEDTGEIEARGSVQVNYRDDPGGTKAGNVRIKLEPMISK